MDTVPSGLRERLASPAGATFVEKDLPDAIYRALLDYVNCLLWQHADLAISGIRTTENCSSAQNKSRCFTRLAQVAH